MLPNFFSPDGYSNAELSLIAQLLSFDAELYRKKFPDVARVGVDPLRHFLSLGMYEGRFPWRLDDESSDPAEAASPSLDFATMVGFDSEFYALRYPDVASDHLQHFLCCGLKEGRQPFNFHDNIAAEALAWDVLESVTTKVDGSFDRQLVLDLTAPDQLAVRLLRALAGPQARPKGYRNNYWLALGAALLSLGQYGAANVCYNNFYNCFLPMPALSDYPGGIYLTGQCFTMANYCQRKDIAVTPLAAAAAIPVADPVFLNRPGDSPSTSELQLPQPLYAVLDNVALIGGSSIILTGTHEFIYDYLDLDGSRPAEFKGTCLLHVSGANCCLKYQSSDLDVDEAFSLMHDHGHNYFHWLIEVLPRYLLARRHGLAKNVTLLIDEQIGHLQEDVLRRVVGAGATLLKVPRHAAVRVGRLHCVTDLSVNTVHTLDLPEKGDILISPTAIALLRDMAQPYFVAGVARYEKLQVLRHNVEFRSLVNRRVLNAMLKENGFRGFDPGIAKFEEQVRTFSNARLIVAEAGAALANMVFCQPGATICILVNGYRNSNYYYLVEMAHALHITVVFFECLRLEGTHELGVHDDMVVDVALLESELVRLAAASAPQVTEES